MVDDERFGMLPLGNPINPSPARRGGRVDRRRLDNNGGMIIGLDLDSDYLKHSIDLNDLEAFSRRDANNDNYHRRSEIPYSIAPGPSNVLPVLGATHFEVPQDHYTPNELANAEPFPAPCILLTEQVFTGIEAPPSVPLFFHDNGAYHSACSPLWAHGYWYCPSGPSNPEDPESLSTSTPQEYADLPWLPPMVEQSVNPSVLEIDPSEQCMVLQDLELNSSDTYADQRDRPASPPSASSHGSGSAAPYAKSSQHGRSAKKPPKKSSTTQNRRPASRKPSTAIGPVARKNRQTDRPPVNEIERQPAETNASHFACGGCEKKFSRRSDLDHHARYHEPGEVICSTCEQAFHFRKDLKRHETTHNGERRFFCDHLGCAYLDSGFKRKDHLRRHKKIHRRGPA